MNDEPQEDESNVEKPGRSRAEEPSWKDVKNDAWAKEKYGGGPKGSREHEEGYY